jgi:hypothetical protein
MVCVECQELLSEFIDGDLRDRKREAVAEHLGSCPRCQALCDDLAKIIEASSHLPLHTPAAGVWSRIEREISSGAGRATWWDRLAARRLDFTVTAQHVVSAAAALVVCAGIIGAVGYTSPGSLPRVEVNWSAFDSHSSATLRPQYLSRAQPAIPEEIDAVRASVEEMHRGVERRQAEWSPELRAAFAKGIAAVDASLAERERDLSAAPSDPARRERLVAAYREKLNFLEYFAKVR